MRKNVLGKIVHTDSSDEAYKARIAEISNPVALLSEWVAARNLGWLSDPCYRDLVDALADRSDELAA